MRNPLINTILTQYHVYKGLKVSDDLSVASFLKELKQLHDRMFMDPKNTDEMNKCQKKAAPQ